MIVVKRREERSKNDEKRARNAMELKKDHHNGLKRPP
ncbi:hypothetical protein A2U01_0055991, partial [Trifolium medium]|nr:hypothetical protein [Trifolium medium]